MYEEKKEDNLLRMIDMTITKIIRIMTIDAISDNQTYLIVERGKQFLKNRKK